MRAATARIPAACTPVAGALLGCCGLSEVPSPRLSLRGATPAVALEPAVIAYHGRCEVVAGTFVARSWVFNVQVLRVEMSQAGRADFRLGKVVRRLLT
jgi:hypothetical protein